MDTEDSIENHKLETSSASITDGALRMEMEMANLPTSTPPLISSAQEPINPSPPPALPVPEQEYEYPQGIQLVLITTVICLAVFLVSLGRTIVATAIPKITDDFHSLDDVGWYGSSYLLTSCAFQLLFGKMYSYVSVKWTFLSAILVFALGSAISGAAPNSITLIIGRAFSGLGCAGTISGATVIISQSIPLRKRPIYMGLVGGVNGVSSVIGPLLGGVFTDKVSWRWCFYINLPISLITLLIIIFLFHEQSNALAASMSRQEKLQQFDLLGTIFFVPSITCLLLALQWGGSTYNWSSWRVILLFVLFAILFIIWSYIQVKKGDLATLPPRIIRQRSVAFGVWFMFALSSVSMIFTYYLPMWFQSILDASPIGSGVDFLPSAIAISGCSLAAGFITTAIGYYVPLMISSSVFASIGAGLLTTLIPTKPDAFWIGSQILFGAGIGLGIQQPLIAIQTVLPAPSIPIAISTIIFSQAIGGSIFLSVGQSVFSNSLISGLETYAPGLDPQIVVNNGAYGLASAIGKIEDGMYVKGVLEAYNKALTTVFMVGVAMAAGAMLGALGMEWKSVKGKEKKIETKIETNEKKAGECRECKC